MMVYLFASISLASFLLVIIGYFFDKKSLLQAGFTLWILGLIGNVVILVSHIEEQKPCRCESCCCVKIERYE